MDRCLWWNYMRAEKSCENGVRSRWRPSRRRGIMGVLATRLDNASAGIVSEMPLYMAAKQLTATKVTGRRNV